MEFLPTYLTTSQSAAGGDAACMTICLHVACYLLNLPPRTPVDMLVLGVLITKSAAFWKNTINDFQTCDAALDTNRHLQLRVEPSGDYVNSINRAGVRVAEIDLDTDLDVLFTKERDIALLFVGETKYSYLLYYRHESDSLLFFNSHGEKATVYFLDDARKPAERAALFLRQKMRFIEKSFSFDMFWLEK